MQYSILAVYKAHLIKKYKLTGHREGKGYIVRVDFGTVGDWDDWIDHWIRSE